MYSCFSCWCQYPLSLFVFAYRPPGGEVFIYPIFGEIISCAILLKTSIPTSFPPLCRVTWSVTALYSLFWHLVAPDPLYNLPSFHPFFFCIPLPDPSSLSLVSALVVLCISVSLKLLFKSILHCVTLLSLLSFHDPSYIIVYLHRGPSHGLPHCLDVIFAISTQSSYPTNLHNDSIHGLLFSLFPAISSPPNRLSRLRGSLQGCIICFRCCFNHICCARHPIWDGVIQ